PSTAAPTSTRIATESDAIASTAAVTALPTAAPSCFMVLKVDEAEPARSRVTSATAVSENGDHTSALAAPNPANAAARDQVGAPAARSAAVAISDAASTVAPESAVTRAPARRLSHAVSGTHARHASPIGTSTRAAD